MSAFSAAQITPKKHKGHVAQGTDLFLSGPELQAARLTRNYNSDLRELQPFFNLSNTPPSI